MQFFKLVPSFNHVLVLKKVGRFDYIAKKGFNLWELPIELNKKYRGLH